MKIHFFNCRLSFTKTIALAILLFAFAFNIYSQPHYPASIQQYIDYKQDTIAFAHCYLADVIHKKVLTDQTMLSLMALLSQPAIQIIQQYPPVLQL
jgi:hypothetical protein